MFFTPQRYAPSPLPPIPDVLTVAQRPYKAPLGAPPSLSGTPESRTCFGKSGVPANLGEHDVFPYLPIFPRLWRAVAQLRSVCAVCPHLRSMMCFRTYRYFRISVPSYLPIFPYLRGAPPSEPHTGFSGLSVPPAFSLQISRAGKVL